MNQNSQLDLRPLSIAELFDRSFRLYRNNFGAFLGIVALTQLPIFALQIVLIITIGQNINADFSDISSIFQGPFVLVTILSVIVSTIFTQLGAAALTQAISDSYLGKKVSTFQAFQRIGRSWLTLIFALFVAGLVVIAAMLPLFLIALIPCVGQVVGIVGIFAIAIVGNVLISLVTPVVILEKIGAGEATRRAWELTKKRFWWIFGYLLLLGILSTLAIDGPTYLFQFLFDSISGNTDLMIRSVVEQAGTLIFSALFLPIELTAITLMYFDLRIRFEGFDLMVLAASSDTVLDDASDLTTQRNL